MRPIKYIDISARFREMTLRQFLRGRRFEVVRMLARVECQTYGRCGVSEFEGRRSAGGRLRTAFGRASKRAPGGRARRPRTRFAGIDTPDPHHAATRRGRPPPELRATSSATRYELSYTLRLASLQKLYLYSVYSISD